MRTIAIVLMFSLLSCADHSISKLSGLRHYPAEKLLKKGLVWKYYSHVSRKDRVTITNINYTKISLSGQTLLKEEYNAEFQKTRSSEIEIQGDKWILINAKNFNHRGRYKELFKEISAIVNENKFVDWSANDAISDRSYLDNESGYRIFNQQLATRDSVVDGTDIRIISGIRNSISIKDGENFDTMSFIWTEQYEAGLGLIYSLISSDKFKLEDVLDEVMSIEEFERRADHGTHRVAYIDSLLTIDDYKLFKPCFHPDKINDYYNDEIAEFKGGKGRLRAILNSKLEPEKIKNEEGYLTYRFIINCHGEAGWFVTEECGLDYEKKKFGEECKMHFYEILKAEKEWTNLSVRGEPRDAYTYLTFKLKNGKVIEILP